MNRVWSLFKSEFSVYLYSKSSRKLSEGKYCGNEMKTNDKIGYAKIYTLSPRSKTPHNLNHMGSVNLQIRSNLLPSGFVKHVPSVNTI